MRAEWDGCSEVMFGGQQSEPADGEEMYVVNAGRRWQIIFETHEAVFQSGRDAHAAFPGFSSVSWCHTT